MKATIAKTLLSFAKVRDKAYNATGKLTGARAGAISKIRNVAGFYTSKPAALHLNAVKQLAPEIQTILPSEQSRYKTLRNQMLELLTAAGIEIQ